MYISPEFPDIEAAAQQAKNSENHCEMGKSVNPE
jgi:hypothetical protein